MSITRREARRLALLTILDESARSLDTSDEWVRHPETDALYNGAECEKVKREARLLLRAFAKLEMPR